jgi:hypothetical protein
MRSCPFVLAAACVAAVLGARGVSAQQVESQGPAPALAAPTPGGWTFSPAIAFNGAYDGNALVSSGGAPLSDFTTVINPRAELSFMGRRGDFAAAYDGSFVNYRDLDSLNSYDQRASAGGRRRLTPHVSIFGRGSIVSVPSTELLELVAVPFVRLGSTVGEIRGGVEAALNRRTSIEADYTAQSVAFGEDPDTGIELFGGHSHGGSFGLRHALNSRITLTGSYFLQRATVRELETFTVQHGMGGVDYKLNEHSSLSGAAGIARLGVSSFSEPRTGLALQAGFSQTFQVASLAVGFSRSFVPVYGFGGTSANSELIATAYVPLARRVIARSAFAWRRNEPLAATDLRLRSLWFDATVGYLVQPWISLEGFIDSTRQHIPREDGTTSRTRIGFQITATKPLRIR